MANYAVINNNIVENVIVADTLEIAEAVSGQTCIEYNELNPASAGDTWDGEKFVKPEIVPPAIEE
jgi:hypothetical protein